MLSCDICGKDDLKNEAALRMHKVHCAKKNAASGEPKPQASEPASQTAPEVAKDDYAELGLRPVVVTREQVRGEKLNVEMGDARLHGRFVRNTPERVRYYEQLGYRIARGDEVAKSSGAVSQDGSVVKGDTVVMTCLKRDKVARRDLRHQENEERKRRMQSSQRKEADMNMYTAPEDTDYSEMQVPRQAGTKMFNIPISFNEK